MSTQTTEHTLPPQTDDELTVTTEQNDFALCPAGQHPARCVDVVYRGEFPNQFKPGTTQKKISIHLMLDTQDDDGRDVRRSDGKRFILSAWFTKSMHEKANLRKTLEGWRGRAFDDSAAESFNLNDLINAPALVNVKHVKNKKGDEIAVIDSISKLPRQMTVFPVEEIEYIRIKDRPRDGENGGGTGGWQGSGGPGMYDDVPLPDDDDLPF
jgi:hypothetical protein